MRWPVEVVEVTGSTNADLVARGRAGEPGPVWLVAHEQTRGRGRTGRAWASPPGDSLAVSVLWRPTVPLPWWTWLPLVVGLGTVDAVASAGVRAALKWPNDVVVPTREALGVLEAGEAVAGGGLGALGGLRKLAGVLVETVPESPRPAVVAGIGLNLRTPPALQAPHATSMADRTGTDPDLGAVADALVGCVTDRLLAFGSGGADPRPGLLEEYRQACTTLGRDVRVLTPSGPLVGTAVDVDGDGALVLRTADGLRSVSAGDVEHVR